MNFGFSSVSLAAEKYFVLTPTISLDARFIQVGDSLTLKCNDYTEYYYVIECKNNNE